MFQRILVATDGSEFSQGAVRQALDLASATGAELVALHVVPRYPTSYFEGGTGASRAEIERTEQEWVRHGQTIVDTVGAEAQSRGVRATAAVEKSDLVAETILAAARKHGCDLIVMASHGRRGLRRVLLGSETQHVLTHGDIPVLVLR